MSEENRVKKFATHQRALFDAAGLVAAMDFEWFEGMLRDVARHGQALSGGDVSVREIQRLAKSARKFRNVAAGLVRVAEVRRKREEVE